MLDFETATIYSTIGRALVGYIALSAICTIVFAIVIAKFAPVDENHP